MKRAEKKARNRQLILTTTTEMIYQVGVAKTNLRQISKLSGLSVVTIYKYFADKTDLINATISQMIEERFERAESLIKTQDLPFIERIEKIPGPDKLNQELPEEIVQELIKTIADSPLLLKTLQKRIKNFFQIIIIEGRKSNYIQTTASDQAIIDLFTLLIFRDNTGKTQPDPQRAADIIQIILYGLTNPGQQLTFHH